MNGAFLSFGCFLKKLCNDMTQLFSLDDEVVGATVHVT